MRIKYPRGSIAGLLLIVAAGACSANKARPEAKRVAAHSRPVFVTENQLPAGTYSLIGPVHDGAIVIQSENKLLNSFAEGVRLRYGADAIMDVRVWWRPSWFALIILPLGIWTPQAEGIAVKLTDACESLPVRGTYRPTGDETNATRIRLCGDRPRETKRVDSSSPRQRKAERKPDSTCTADQVLKMKASGLSDGQIRAACR